MTLERLMQNAVEVIRGMRPAWALRYVEQNAVIDADGDGDHDDCANPDTGAGSRPGNLVIDVFDRAGQLHRFDEEFVSEIVRGAPEAADATKVAVAIIEAIENSGGFGA